MKAPKARFKILPYTNPRTGTPSWRVTGTRRNGERIRENFARAEEAQYRHTELEGEFHAANGVAALRATRLLLMSCPCEARGLIPLLGRTQSRGHFCFSCGASPERDQREPETQ